MICTKCGRTLPDGAKFCTFCGRQLRVPTPPAAESAPQTLPRPAAVFDPDVRYDDVFSGTTGAAAQAEPRQSPVQPEPWNTPTQQNPSQPVYLPRQNDPQFQTWGGAPAYGGAQPMPENPTVVPNMIGQTRVAGWKKAVSAFLCVFLVLSCLAAATVFAIRSAFNSETIRETINELDAREIEMQSPDGEILTLPEYIRKVLKSDMEKDYGINDRELTDLLNARFFKDYLADRLGNYADYLLGKDELDPLTEKEVANFLLHNSSEIYRITGYDYTDDIDSYVTEDGRTLYESEGVRTLFESIGRGTLDEQYLEASLGSGMKLLRFALSLPGQLILAGLALVLLIVIFLILIGHGRSAFLHVGISLTVAGFLALAAGTAGMIALKIRKLDLLSAFLEKPSFRLILVGGILLVVGVAMIFLRLVFKKEQKIAAVDTEA